ncbi:spermidine synthase [Actinoallomurus sp. CA-142502]|uniref:spermidine synthase n=1 Tax=Actinoallomurus sp. CA-142502 TaxID=3239885 RepID=UPI003D89F34B
MSVAEIKPHLDAAKGAPATRGPVGVAVVVFTLTTLMAASLLFTVEPMVAKMLLPIYGGSPMVWNTSMLFFQVALLLGYTYAHLSQRLLGARWQPLVHIPLVVVPLLVLPMSLPGWAVSGGSAPVALWLLLVLTAVVGAPFAVLSTIGPLIQRWYSWAGLPRSKDPYFLYAASNVGSMLALLAYPFLIEPAADLEAQARWWALGYRVFVVLVVACVLIIRFRSSRTPAEASAEEETATEEAAERITWRRRLRWLGLAFIPSSLMLGATTHISTDIAPVPLMWVVPLALYLATFIIAFGSKKHRWLSHTVTIAALSAAVIPWTLFIIGPDFIGILLALALVLVAGLACHGLLAKDRPNPRRLTEFFLIISLGGAFGGAFNTLVAPVVFNWTAEFPLVVTSLAVLPILLRRMDATTRWNLPGAAVSVKAFVVAAPLVLLAGTIVLRLGASSFLPAVLVIGVPWCVLAIRRPRMMAIGVALSTVLLLWYRMPTDSIRMRTFFGNYHVYMDGSGRRMFGHGSTVHGFQFTGGPLRTTPVAYFGRSGPFGDLFTAYGERSSRVAIVGLGTGVMAAYGHQGQTMDFYEIDPVVLRIASNWFSYLTDSKADVNAIVGDGRLELEKVPDGSYGMIVLDAFTSDSVPPHLLTYEALQLYTRKLAPGGVLAFNVTNRSLDLAPMLAATARAAGLASMTGNGAEDPQKIYYHSRWVAIARKDADLRPLRAKSWRWHTPPAGGPVWTDAHSSLFGVLNVGR